MKAKTVLAKAQLAETVAATKVADVTAAKLKAFIGLRSQTVKAFETSIVFIGDANKLPAKKSDTGAAPPAATETGPPGDG